MKKIKTAFSLVEMVVVLSIIGLFGSLIQVAGDAIWSDIAMESYTQKLISDIEHVRAIAMKYGGQSWVRFYQLEDEFDGNFSYPISINPDFQVEKGIILQRGILPDDFAKGPIDISGKPNWKRFELETIYADSSFLYFYGQDNDNETGDGIGKHFNSAQDKNYFIISFNSRGKLAPTMLHTENHLGNEVKFTISDGRRTRTVLIQTNGMVTITKG
ncbi:Tfp pilus assembly protein FimT/FimU [Candidatus Riflebacteria bacterium]